jgi:hypothetical protein
MVEDSAAPWLRMGRYGPMRRVPALALPVVLGLLVVPTAARAEGRIAFSTDREGTRDVGKVKDDGSSPTQVTDDEGEAH